MYLKIAGSILIVGCSAAIGFSFSRDLSGRISRLQEWKRLLLNLKGELGFRHASLTEAFQNVSERVHEPYAGLLQRVSERLKERDGHSYGEIWKEELENLQTAEHFCETDYRLVEELSEGLGVLDLTMQQDTLQMLLQRTEEAIEEASAEKRQKGRMYEMLGIMLGMFVVILII